MDSSSLTRWRKRIGEEGVETLLMASIDAARKIGMMKASSVDRVIVNTTLCPRRLLTRLTTGYSRRVANIWLLAIHPTSQIVPA